MEVSKNALQLQIESILSEVSGETPQEIADRIYSALEPAVQIISETTDEKMLMALSEYLIGCMKSVMQKSLKEEHEKLEKQESLPLFSGCLEPDKAISYLRRYLLHQRADEQDAIEYYFRNKDLLPRLLFTDMKVEEFKQQCYDLSQF